MALRSRQRAESATAENLISHKNTEPPGSVFFFIPQMFDSRQNAFYFTTSDKRSFTSAVAKHSTVSDAP